MIKTGLSALRRAIPFFMPFAQVAQRGIPPY